jgi:hypothetical protein
VLDAPREFSGAGFRLRKVSGVIAAVLGLDQEASKRAKDSVIDVSVVIQLEVMEDEHALASQHLELNADLPFAGITLHVSSRLLHDPRSTPVEENEARKEQA